MTSELLLIVHRMTIVLQSISTLSPFQKLQQNNA